MDGRAIMSVRSGTCVQAIPIANLPNHTIGTFANNILDVVLLADIEGNLPGTAPSLCVTHVGLGRVGLRS